MRLDFIFCLQVVKADNDAQFLAGTSDLGFSEIRVAPYSVGLCVSAKPESS